MGLVSTPCSLRATFERRRQVPENSPVCRVPWRGWQTFHAAESGWVEEWSAPIMCAAGTYRHGRSSQDRGMTATRGVFRGDAEPDGTDMVSRQCPLWDDLLPAAPAERCRHGEHSSSYVRAKRRAPACQPDGALGAPAATLQAASYSFYCQRRDCKAAAAMRGAQRAQRGGGRRTFNTRIDRHGSTDLPAHHLKRHSWAFGAPQLSLLMLVLMSLGGPRETEGWIALSKDGYVVTRGLGLRCVD